MESSMYIFYLLVYKISIVTAGIICITLGYKLFAKGIFPDKPAGNSDIGAEMGDLKLSFKNAAPGSTFALLGAVIIAVMIWKSPAEVNITKNGETQTTSFRGDETDSDVSKKSTPNDSTNHTQNQYLAETMNAMAWHYFEHKQFEGALSLSKSAIALAPLNANYIDTYADILFALNRKDEALPFAQKAAELNPNYKAKLEKYKK